MPLFVAKNPMRMIWRNITISPLASPLYHVFPAPENENGGLFELPQGFYAGITDFGIRFKSLIGNAPVVQLRLYRSDIVLGAATVNVISNQISNVLTSSPHPPTGATTDTIYTAGQQLNNGKSCVQEGTVPQLGVIFAPAAGQEAVCDVYASISRVPF
jgi:hypothetical protein